MLHLNAETLTAWVSQIFQAVGAPVGHADRVAHSLVQANLTGHDSHGVIRVRQYVAEIENGRLDPAAQPIIATQAGAITQVDARLGFGQVAAHFAIGETIRQAQSHGLGVTALQNSHHVGRVGEWVEMAALQNMIGLAFCNGGSPGGLVTPYGGAERKLGTNPFAAAVPVNGRSPLLLDFATSVLAEGKVRVALNKGKPLPEGILLDKEGRASTRPQDLYEGGMLLPAGLYKGFGLSLLVEILGGLLTGMGSPALPEYSRFFNGVLFLVLAIEPFRPLADFLADAARLSEQIKAARPAPGFESVLLPGEPEEQTAVARRAAGIPLDEMTWGELTAVALRLGVAVDLG